MYLQKKNNNQRCILSHMPKTLTEGHHALNDKTRLLFSFRLLAIHTANDRQGLGASDFRLQIRASLHGLFHSKKRPSSKLNRLKILTQCHSFVCEIARQWAGVFRDSFAYYFIYRTHSKLRFLLVSLATSIGGAYN